MYGRRVPKTHPRVEAYGALDELNAALGLARASATPGFVPDALAAIQQDLIVVMGELATDARDRDRYLRDGFSSVTPQLTGKLDEMVRKIEFEEVSAKGWAIPGADVSSATLDMARTICRRAERRVCDLRQAGEMENAAVLTYLNRLADLLWLMARLVEMKKPGGG